MKTLSRGEKMALTKRKGRNISEHFWSKVDISKKEECWNWTACRNKDGYGVLKYNNKKITASRFSWKESFGEIPMGLCVLHRCDNPPCVNPKHLWLVTQRANILDAVKKNRNYVKINRAISQKYGIFTHLKS